jgi:glycerol-3-phosphate dehydrogenase (NAD(P)+)
MDNGINVSICGTEYDIEILDLLRKGEKHPRIGVGLEGINILYPEMMSEAVADHDVVLLAVSTDGVESVFSRINQDLDGKIVVTISKGFLEYNGEVVTIPQFMESKNSKIDIVAITGPSIAREVAVKNPTRVVFSSKSSNKVELLKEIFETNYYRITTSDDIIGTEVTSALKNVYSIGIAWIRGYEERKGGIEMSNLKGVIAAMAIDEISRFVQAMGGRKETVYGLSGFGDLIATFRGGRNGMLGELLGKGYSINSALDELKRRGVGVVEGYNNSKRAYTLLKNLEKENKLNSKDFPFLIGIVEVLKGADVEDVLFRII